MYSWDHEKKVDEDLMAELRTAEKRGLLMEMDVEWRLVERRDLRRCNGEVAMVLSHKGRSKPF